MASSSWLIILARYAPGLRQIGVGSFFAFPTVPAHGRGFAPAQLPPWAKLRTRLWRLAGLLFGVHSPVEGRIGVGYSRGRVIWSALSTPLCRRLACRDVQRQGCTAGIK